MVDLVNVCPSCGLEEENVMHALCSCFFASHVWSLSQLPIPSFNGRNFKQWVEGWLAEPAITPDTKGRICGFLYDIWTSRNAAVWEGFLPYPQKLLRGSFARWEAWKISFQQHVRNLPFQVAEPIPDPHSAAGVICYVDAGFHGPQHAPSYGFIVYEADGTFMAAANGPLTCSYDPILAEALAMCEALSWLKDNGYTAVTLCSR
ncbi:PREDICTED: uncharacterized protein LOC109165612 [Ipomoea nil]|uniref:uncharacterized protein LOC109165612 n=1 Tax=Ipomoea nil TaxID=35883 RepID=UPI000900ED87|nr:PREDICTED: uncharacterized protein LOC109165612 [Ipomoea nil]